MRLKLLIVGIMFAAGCGEDVSSRATDRDSASAADTSSSSDTTAQTEPSGSNGDHMRSPDSAVAVLREYYDAIAARDYARAHALWSNEGEASGQTFDEFRKGFAQTATAVAQIGTPGRVEGAAGSRYIEIPVTVLATTTQGGTQCFRGTYTLRRSEVMGATAEQQRWRIQSASINEQPAAECSGTEAD